MDISLPEKYVGDVLFINGCDPQIAPHPYRYRVQHQREQLLAYGLSSNEVFYTQINTDIIRDYRVIIFYRCPWCDPVERSVQVARKYNKTILYDIDDLVIDTVYTDQIPYVQGLTGEAKAEYNSGVIRMGKTLSACEAAITTTECLKEELEKYVPEVFLNRNRASDEMVKYSEIALAEKEEKPEDDSVTIGYFSGSITHNADIELLLPVLQAVMEKYPQVRLLTVGELEIPDELAAFSDRILHEPFVDWKELPKLIAKADINIAPLEDTIFNAAKSENKWLEAALVKVPTIASDLGAFHVAVKNHETGLLCKNSEEWICALEKMIENPSFRKQIAENAYIQCHAEYITLTSGEPLARFIQKKMRPKIAFVLPSLQISGGIMVALSHAAILQDAGWDVDILATEENENGIMFRSHTFNTIDFWNRPIDASYDVMVATMWTTTGFVMNYGRAERKLYLVQNYETDFYENGIPLRLFAEQSYHIEKGLEYLTISKWCQNWLVDRYGHKETMYIPNGLWKDSYQERERDFSGKIRILIEGDCTVAYKNVDESFEIVSRLDPERFEVWYLSYNGTPKEHYRVDKFFNRVRYEKVGLIYEQCDILLKSSYLESFSYPPIEMMATGGFSVVVENDGNREYIKDEYNCLTYEKGDVEGGVKAILRICDDADLREKLQKGGKETARSRGMESIRQTILDYYGRDVSRPE